MPAAANRWWPCRHSCSAYVYGNVACTTAYHAQKRAIVSRTDEQPLTSDAQDVAQRDNATDYRRAAHAPTDRPRPYSYEDLSERLDRLPRGHPSSPYNGDGSRKPPPPDLRALELPLPDQDPDDWLDHDLGEDHRETTPPELEPLTDAEHAEHVRYVEHRLDWARTEGLATDQ
jgi:hypothetical protein